MTLTEYQNAAQRTLPDLGFPFSDNFTSEGVAKQLSLKLNLAHMVMGMGSEISEICDAIDKDDDINLSEEFADIMWYVANYCNLRGFDLEGLMLEPLENEPEGDTSYGYKISELIDYVKKFVAYNKPLDIEKELSAIYCIVNSLMGEFTEMNITFEQALQNNIDKLRARYPEKFTEEAALNRNLDAERKELEK